MPRQSSQRRKPFNRNNATPNGIHNDDDAKLTSSWDEAALTTAGTVNRSDRDSDLGGGSDREEDDMHPQPPPSGNPEPPLQGNESASKELKLA